MNSLAFLVILGLSAVSGYLPPSMSVCNRDAPDLDKCVLAVVEKMRAHIVSGDYGNGTKLPSLDPLYMERLDIDDGTNLQATFRNTVITGAKNFHVDKMHVNPESKTINLLITLDKVILKGKYNMNLRLGLLLIDGDGDSVLEITDVKLLLKMHYFFAENSSGRKTMQFHPIDVKMKYAGTAKFNMTNLLKGKPRLGQAANDAINESPDVILEKTRQPVEQFFSKLFTTIANGLMNDAEEQEAFPL
uniref:Putative hemolymph juvenile hormone binding protein n=1 Tax=Aedes albopictus TaxID=7160 RepID=A0A023EKY1_AEDAL